MSGFPMGTFRYRRIEQQVEESLIRVADFPMDLPIGTERRPVLDS
jgi:hypothetical protein